jgi:diguanylate cyclase (GGDEF)-like protein
MKSVVRGYKLGDRMIVVVGMLVAVAVTALLGFAVLVANRVDEDVAVRELALAESELNEKAKSMKADLAVYSRWDEAFKRVTETRDTDWIHRHLGARLHRASGHHRTYVLDQNDQPVYAAIDGTMVGADAYRVVAHKIAPLAQAARHAHAVDHILGRSGAEAEEPPFEGAVEVAYRRIEDRPALLGVTTIVSGLRRANGQSNPSAVVISLAFLNDEMLSQLALNLGSENLAVRAEPPSEGKLGVELPLGTSESAWLVWTPRAPGTAMLMRLLPGLIAVVALLGLITLLVMIYVRRTAERLDYSERRATELAYRDRLTGLANRVQLLETLSERLDEVGPERRIALVLIDIDDFKNINDTLGHPTGDEVLFAMGERLTTIAGASGMAVRFGGDEFALLVPVAPGTDDLFAVCRRVNDSVRTPVIAGGQFFSVSATVGVAVAPEDAMEAEQLMRRAEIALYRAKVESRGGYRLFDPSYEEILHKRRAIERDLSRALDNEELAVKFQPIYAADGERMVGVEALVRWNHPDRGVVPPSEFIPVAEQTGLVVRLDEWVLRRACEYAMQWSGLSLAVNLSASNFRQLHVAERITRVLTDTGFDPRRLEIEITESMLLGATGEVLGELSELRRMGVRIALDDFGTGYSSLGYLRRFPVDKLKIDRSFVQNLGITEDAAAIVECVTRLGRALGLAVTAEGVESSEQHRFVRSVGCHQVQGYLFSAPVEPERIDEMVASDAPSQSRTPKQRFATA